MILKKMDPGAHMPSPGAIYMYISIIGLNINDSEKKGPQELIYLHHNFHNISPLKPLDQSKPM